MKIYTKTGDDGETGLFGGGRVSKASDRVSAYGTVDELNAVLGVAIALTSDEFVRDLLTRIQSRLFDVGAELATAPGKEEKLATMLVQNEHISELERAIDQAETELPPLTSFILPGGSRVSAELHVARTVCRRAEREVVRAFENEKARPELLRYLNRLSDLLFMLARLENHRAGVVDISWHASR